MQETKYVGGLSEHMWGKQYHQQDRVYNMGQCALALTANISEGSYKYVEIKAIGKLSNSNQRNVVYDKNAISPTIQAALGEGGGNCPLVVDDIKVIGKMDHTMDHTFESANRIYGTDGICPTLPTCGGGNIQPKIMECVAMRGRGEKNEQQLEVRSDGCTNSITTAQKDNMVLIRQATKDEEWTWEIDGEIYRIRIRKLTPKECWRLMGFTDEDFDKAQEVNSNTQLYKQAGNSIVVPVLEGIFKELIG